MKALSFRQPWAELVLQGRKTLDVRTYTTTHRGLLAIHASTNIDREACKVFGFDPANLMVGAVIGTVELVDVQPLTLEQHESRQADHLTGHRYRETFFGWELAEPQRLARAVKARGRTRLFEVALETPVDKEPRADTIISPALPMTGQEPPRAQAVNMPADTPFALEVVPEDQNSYGLALKQLVLVNADEDNSRQVRYGASLGQLTTIVTLSGPNLRAVAGQVLERLREAGYKPTDLSPHRRKPFYLPEPVGVRLGLLCLAVKPLSKMVRVEEIAHGINRMSHEETYYWYSKCTATDTAERAQKALRVLLAAE